MSGDDDLKDDRCAFADENLVAEFLGADLEVGDRALSTLLAIESELIVVRWASLGIFQAMRQEQQSAIERYSRDLLTPELIHARDERDAKVLLAKPLFTEKVIGKLLRLDPCQGLAAVDTAGKLAGSGAHLIP